MYKLKIYSCYEKKKIDAICKELLLIFYLVNHFKDCFEMLTSTKILTTGKKKKKNVSHRKFCVFKLSVCIKYKIYSFK